jgi:RNase P subunit RPR2
MTKESGVLTKAEVYNRPECGRGSATADVIIAERIFTIDIGDELEVLYCKKCGTAILPHSKANIRYWFSIVFFALPLYFLIILVSSFKRED